jgi:hypothetical protein
MGIHPFARTILVLPVSNHINPFRGDDQLALLDPAPIFDETRLKRRSVAQAAALIAKQQARHPTPSL